MKRLGLLVGALLAGACGGDESIDREERGGDSGTDRVDGGDQSVMRMRLGRCEIR